MDILKAGAARSGGSAAGELEAINAFARKTLSEEEVYVFSVLLCDNEVDRDFERFSEKTLEELRELFVGKTGIADHDWSAGSQKARIYRTELITEPSRVTGAGTPYMYLKGFAYMLRTPENQGLIAEIEGGIKRETSVGCSVSRTVCSVCGEELGSCAHVKGREYNGRLCWGELSGAVDAYEWSFVAVPAQREAGVLKKRSRREDAEFKSLRCRAALGDRYLSLLRAEVKRLSLLCGDGLGKALELTADGMDAAALESFKDALEQKAARLLPLQTQLPGREETSPLSGEEYRV